MNDHEFIPTQQKTSHVNFFLAGFIFLGLFLVYFKSILFSNSLLVSDGLVPVDFTSNSWSNNIFSGYPLLADPIGDTHYPIKTIIYKILKLDFNYFIIFGYFLMAFFTYLYVYALTNLNTSAFISAIIYSFSGYAIFEIGHAANFIHTICWMPLILLAFEKLRYENSIIWVLISVFAIAMTICGGFAQLSLAIFPVILSYGLYLAYQSDKKFRKAMFYLSILVAGYLLAAPIIVPTFILSQFSDRTHLSWEAFSTYYVEFKQLLLFIFPFLMGGYYGLYAKTPSFGNWEFVGNHGFIGFLTLVLAGISIFKCTKASKSVTYFWLVFSFLSLITAIGPGIKFFYRFLYHIPVVNNFRAPERYLFIFSFGLSVLAGIGIQTLQLGNIQLARHKNIIFILAIILATFILGSVIWIYPFIVKEAMTKMHFQLPVFYKNPAVIVPTIWILSSLIGLFFLLQKPKSFFYIFLVITILTAELLYTAYFSYWHPNYGPWHKGELHNPPPYINELRDNLNVTKQRYLKMQLPSDAIGKYLWGNMPLYYNLPSAGGYSPLSMVRYTNFMGISSYGSYIAAPDQLKDNQAINIAGIKYLFTVLDPLNALWFKDTKQFKLHTKIGDTIVYENKKALPRVWFTSNVITLPDAEMLQVIHTGRFSDGTLFNPVHTALTKKFIPFNFEDDKTAQANITKMTHDKVVIITQTHKPQFMVLSDVYYPGWKAYIDGNKSKFYLTDYVYRGIVIPAGYHKIIFKFRPLYLYISYVISALTLLSILSFFLVLRIRDNTKI